MSKITKKQLQESHNKLLNQFASLVRELKVNNIIDDSVCPTFTKKTEPQLKQLDQGVFDGLDEKWRFAVIQNNGFALICTQLPFVAFGGSSWDWNGYSDVVGKGYDASDWQNSLIERESKELTGSDLCRKMLERGDKHVLCSVDDCSDNDAINDLEIQVVGYISNKEFVTQADSWKYAVPINNQGEPLTASEVGL